MAIEARTAGRRTNTERLAIREHSMAHEIVQLPLFARLYRGAFKSGSGEDWPRWKQLPSRLGYYVLGLFLHGPRWGTMRLSIRGQPKSVRFDCRNRQFNTLYFHKYHGGYEPPVSAALLELLPRDGVFLDVGSNWGYYSLLVAKQEGFSGHVHAFEPWPSSFADLSGMIHDTGLSAFITAHPAALSERSGPASMASGRHSGLAHLVSAGPGVPVEMKRMDDLNLPPPSIVKLDVEGFEMEALRGGEQTLRAARPLILFESALGDGEKSLAVMRLLESWGFSLFIPKIEASSGEADARTRRPRGTRLVLQPVSSATRSSQASYLNLLAAPSERSAELGEWIEQPSACASA